MTEIREQRPDGKRPIDSDESTMTSIEDHSIKLRQDMYKFLSQSLNRPKATQIDLLRLQVYLCDQGRLLVSLVVFSSAEDVVLQPRNSVMAFVFVASGDDEA